MPEIYHEFAQIAEKLEKHYKDMQDMEFTIEKGKLYMLQTRKWQKDRSRCFESSCRPGRRRTYSKQEALLLVDPRQLDTLLHPTFEPNALKAALQ